MFQAMIRQEHSGLLVMGLFAVLRAVAVWRVIAVAGLWVPLDPNEGWNAYHTAAVLGGSPLYPDPSGYLVNNYPPLSFYVVAALGRLLGDTIVAGRILSLLSLAAIAISLYAAALWLMLHDRRSRSRPPGVDVFNVGQQFATGVRSDAELVGWIASKQFGVVQIDPDDPHPLTSDADHALDRSYRVHHRDDFGTFYVPRP